LVNPVTDIGDVVEDPLIDPGEDKAIYKLFVDGFPKYVGTLNATFISPEEDPGLAVPIIGALG
jgi:hypothetical protein